MSRKAEREREILQAVDGGVCKDDLMAKLVGDCAKSSVIKSLQRAYRNLLKKGSMIEELKTMLRGYRIATVTWVNCSQKSENTISENNSTGGEG